MGLNSSLNQPNRAVCVEYESSNNPNESSIFINSIRLKENGGKPICTFRSQPDSLTVTDILDTSVILYNDLPCMGERLVNNDGSYGKYSWINYSDFRKKCLNFASGLQSIGIRQGDYVGIFSPSCINWQVSFFGCLYIGAIPVTLYDYFGPQANQFIVENSKLSCLIAHSQFLDTVKTILTHTTIEHLILISHLVNPPFISIDEVFEKGAEFTNFQKYKPSPDDTAIIMYTSGSLGTPKGCIITHKNLVAGSTGLGSAGTSLTTRDTYLSYLPLAHIYEMCCQLIMLAQGARIGFFSGDTRDLFRDCKELQPTIMCGVPRIFNRFVDSVKKSIDEMSTIPKILTQWAIRIKSKALLNSENYSMFLDYFIFSHFKEELGGRLRLIVVGGAPILPENYEFLRTIITPNIIQGYGLTEICAAGCITEIGEGNSASVGPVSIATDMKFRSVEGMYYDPKSAQPSGEILFRGTSLFSGYLNNQKATDEAFDGEWFLTGDVGFLNSEGHVQIIDRVGQLVKLSHGDYISLSKLMELYQTTQGVEYIYVFADSHHSQPVAVVVPTVNCIEDWKGRGIKVFQSSQIAREEMLKKLDETAEKLKLRGFEKIYDIILEQGITADDENDSSDHSSLKPRLSQLRLKYEARLVELYNNKPFDSSE